MTRIERDVLTLYGDGMSTIDIANRLGITRQWVYECLSRNHVRMRKKCGTILSGRGISAWRIVELRKKTKPGQRILVKSTRNALYGDGEKQQHVRPRILVKVISNANPYFCLVELPSGMKESILWIDLIGENLDRY